ncbi:SIMPL domain-containing protein [Parerythrobacter lacustris]|uniref:SIMPL domain-containing protein n=1 Tax=Parerythrobacter lacustris TaxID=2969984 RepID=A0ABT1XSD4_9SPHN|nr:SIMPL domain-containing protein [Parerythrobacter lacustris]MCR2834574.1 SIMPL domain-containing protein [Parerythrobacter lacustris]
MRMIALAACGLALAFSTPVAAQGIQGLGILALDPVDEGNTVLTITGKASVTREPDVASFTAGVTTVAPTAEQALRENAATMQKLVAAARRQGIAESDIRTSEISISPVFEVETYDSYSQGWKDATAAAAEGADPAAEAVAAAVDAAAAVGSPSKPKTPRITGYQANNAVSIRQRKLDDFGGTIDALVAAGANNVAGPSFRLEDSTEAENEARTKAIADARSRAELYAAAAGMTVKRIIMIDEGRTSSLSSGYDESYGFAMAETYDVYTPSPVLKGDLTIGASVGVMFELAPR